jgi:hypothetical protein
MDSDVCHWWSCWWSRQIPDAASHWVANSAMLHGSSTSIRWALHEKKQRPEEVSHAALNRNRSINISVAVGLDT